VQFSPLAKELDARFRTRIEREDADRHAVQDEIVARLARKLQVEILPIESARRSTDTDTEALIYHGWRADPASAGGRFRTSTLGKRGTVTRHWLTGRLRTQVHG
jgi:hypothetical protein